MNKNNNFDFLRFLFALLVVISHAYPLSGVNEKEQWIYRITNGQMIYSSIGLNGFFVISGFFIFKSLQRSRNLKEYYFKRFLRLFPGLFVVLLLTLMIVPLIYKSNVPYLLNREFYTYLPNNLSLYGFQAIIKGVFDTNYYHAINGSLWTIRYEFSLYIALSILFYFRKNPTLIILLLTLVFVLFYIAYVFFLDRLANSSVFNMLGYEILNLGTFFIGGSLLAVLNFENFKKKQILFLLATLIFICSIYFNFYELVKHLIFPIIIIIVGHKIIPFFSTFGKYGDASYGIYIYSFPIQQSLVFFFKFEIFELLLSSVILSTIFGYLSWHFVEKKALKYKNRFVLNKKPV